MRHLTFANILALRGWRNETYDICAQYGQPGIFSSKKNVYLFVTNSALFVYYSLVYHGTICHMYVWFKTIWG